MTDDPLSDALSLLAPTSSVSSGFEAGGDWAVRFDDQWGRIKCYVATAGACRLAVEGHDEQVEVRAGDGFILATGRPFVLASDLALPPIDARSIFPPAVPGGVVSLNGGDGFALVGSRFAVESRHATVLLSALPPIIHLKSAADRDALRWSVERMMQEIRAPRPGGALVARHLAHMMLIQGLRQHLSNPEGIRTGWFAALADPRLRAATAAMHRDPARRWSLADLAREAGMSRSSFAQAFRDRTGETPMSYLARWRMMLAADRLAAGEPASAIAPSLGYESDSAFGVAFKRTMGRSPRAYAGTRSTGAQAPSDRTESSPAPGSAGAPVGAPAPGTPGGQAMPSALL